MKITDLRDHFSHNFSRSKAMRIARLLEQYDHPKIQNSYLASSRITSSNVYYIIWRKGGGFFSILSSVLCHLQIAENLGFSPVVDFKNFTSTYSENEQINGSHRMKTIRYFKPTIILKMMRLLISTIQQSTSFLPSAHYYGNSTTTLKPSTNGLLKLKIHLKMTKICKKMNVKT